MLIEQIFDWAGRQPAKPALIHNDAQLSYVAFARKIGATHQFLTEQAVPPGGTAVVLAENLRDAWPMLIALHAVGLNTVMVRSIALVASLGIKDCACIVGAQADQAALDSGAHSLATAKTIVVPSSLDAGIHGGGQPHRPAIHHPQGGHILYTSGTTGTYKKVFQDAACDEKRVSLVAQSWGFGASTVYQGGNFGLWTAAGYWAPRAVWHRGGCVVTDQRIDFLTHLFDHGPTDITMLPQDLSDLLRLPELPKRPAPKSRIVAIGGFLPLATAREVVRRFTDNLTVLYSSTECPSVMQQTFETKDDLVWLTPNRLRIVQVVDEAGKECPDGQEGALRIFASDGDCQSYVDDEEASARMFRHGFFYPGDLAVRRADGRIRVLGRVSDVINIRGQKVLIAPVERMIQDRLQVDEVCLFSGFSDEGEDSLVIAIESARELPKTELDALARDFAPFENVRVSVLTEFPRTATGMKKIDRLALRRLVVSRDDPGR